MPPRARRSAAPSAATRYPTSTATQASAGARYMGNTGVCTCSGTATNTPPTMTAPKPPTVPHAAMSEIRIVQDEAVFEVWLDAECDGLCIGVGSTREEALAQAEMDLQMAFVDLRELIERQG